MLDTMLVRTPAASVEATAGVNSGSALRSLRSVKHAVINKKRLVLSLDESLKFSLKHSLTHSLSFLAGLSEPD